MNKLHKGYYYDCINGFSVSVISTQLNNGKIIWYNTLEYKERTLIEGTDFYTTKKAAYEAICYVANNPNEYGIVKHTI